MNVIQIILENLAELLPWVVILTFEGGVRWTLGKNPVALGPGFHWRILGIHRVEVIDVVDQFFETPIQSVITQDGTLVCFSVNVGYRITDTVKHFCEVSDFQEAIQALAESHLAARVREQSYDDVVSDLKKLETSCRGTLTTRVQTWGTEIFLVGFTNFAKVPNQFRIFGGLAPD